MKRKVKLHPLPQGTPAPLAEFIGNAVAGAVKSALGAHCKQMSRHTKGMLVGSIRKRAVNQIVCVEGLVKLRKLIQPPPGVGDDTDDREAWMKQEAIYRERMAGAEERVRKCLEGVLIPAAKQP